MDRLIYTSLSAMRGAMARQQATANNLANASTPGFRADVAEAQARWLEGQSVQDRAMAAESVINADMKPGSVTSTGRDLDVALSGDSLLSVQSAEGEEAYTRRGDLQIAASGLLTTGDGRPVLGDGGPITIPAADKVSISQDGKVMIVPSGGDPSQPQEVDRLKLVSPTGSAIAKGLDGLFRVQGGGALPADPDARVASGQLEASNVSATQALVDMIDAGRAWDMQLKLVTSARDLDGASADLMRLPE
ncbi:flagellar basal body rod protein FlgF [Sphingomonas ginkgonis]|uniref:Flagellar basal-body rod protein FlgF n=1 Tax=Sphingomonas ginkgonis TaxID=2315330 RepID=A0A429VC19_9SPHN|nr:flagellar basal body rod protein FlgF [Sphingomonas ginkgonis]RST31545.1 flagellar basal body rod protein FlgF [Sphingomonas ginkgonis]